MAANDRVRKLRESMKSAGIDALFVSQPQNVYYLTGFRCRSWSLCQPLTDPEGFVVVEQEKLTFLCDDRYDPGAAKRAGFSHERIKTPCGPESIAQDVGGVLSGNVRTLGYETGALLHCDAVGLTKTLERVRWQPADELIGNLRIIKDDAELALLRHAARITDGAFTHVVGQLRIGMSEKDVADEINGYLRRNSEGLAFDSIVAFDAAAAAPHYHPGPTNKLRKGSLVLMDFGAVWEGYHGDMTRVVFMGKADAKQRERYEAVLASQEACLKGLKAGVIEGDADGLSRNALVQRKMGDLFVHGTGHGVGLAIHEAPRLKQKLTTKLRTGMVVTVEPGVYEEGWGGIRIEDVAIIRDDGIENITHSPKQLMEVSC